jgi:hypothetical protein
MQFGPIAALSQAFATIAIVRLLLSFDFRNEANLSGARPGGLRGEWFDESPCRAIGGRTWPVLAPSGSLADQAFGGRMRWFSAAA